ncbi:hypothetical protein [Streptomyces flavofungini]|uniref:hypothetical protein n=1 Tax=Streptomyces flavofungini TaxID=68200 RepID=UPI0025B016D6|nr:hypothetical protein [Streptomyces flavofungini]WJV46500.1 hypothetical protein QUY26_13755 [Streptomyces flavofungini]
MRVRRTVGAAALALTAVAVLSGCTDDPEDKAFGGGDAPAPPTMPTMPGPSLSPRPSGLPDTPGTSSGGSSESGGLSSGGSSGSGGLTSGGSSGSGGLSSGGSSSQPTYDSNAIGEVIGQNCSYERSTGRINYDVDIQNSSSDQAFRYSFSVVFKVGQSPSSAVASRTIAYRSDTVTVSSGGDRTVKMHAPYSTNDRLVYSCQVTSARKYPAT